jgi:hypothetical protein
MCENASSGSKFKAEFENSISPPSNSSRAL